MRLADKIEAALEQRDPINPFCTARKVDRSIFAQWLSEQIEASDSASLGDKDRS